MADKGQSISALTQLSPFISRLYHGAGLSNNDCATWCRFWVMNGRAVNFGAGQKASDSRRIERPKLANRRHRSGEERLGLLVSNYSARHGRAAASPNGTRRRLMPPPRVVRSGSAFGLTTYLPLLITLASIWKVSWSIG